jgi:hypothetical protein
MMTVDEFWSAIGRVLLLGYAARVAYTIGRDNEARRRERATEARELARIERRRAIRAAALAALKPELDKLDEATRTAYLCATEEDGGGALLNHGSLAAFVKQREWRHSPENPDYYRGMYT